MTVCIRGKVRPRTPAKERLSVIELILNHLCIHTKGVVDAHGPGHTLLTLDGGEDLGRVLEGDGSLTQAVGNSEEIDESCKC